ncbi:MAG: phenylalanine--tRNA ligase beta subunit-related protein [Candidatus Woesebacteria bacterium]|nr:phenylalanine--tRNA ligase beta subunit-related protein [Candidatus Woesebacteria bacterium]
MNINFQHQKIGAINGFYATLSNLDIHKINPELEKIKSEALQKALSYSDSDITNFDVNKGYTEILNEFNHSELIPAGQNFVEMIRKRNKFPTINTAVDAYNSTVVDSFLAIGAHDLLKIKGDITFNYAKNGELIPAVNMTDAYKISEGDYIYRDEEKVLAWLDVRDTDLAKIEDNTKDIVLIIEGNRLTSTEYIESSLKNACELIKQFCRGTYEIHKITNK